MNSVTNFILDRIPIGIIVFDKKMDVIFCNRQAEKFFKRHKPPDEITTICRRIFDAISKSRLKELFPGEIYLHKKLKESQSNWTFIFHPSERPKLFVSVFIVEESVSNKLNLNRIRDQFKLTRRETDVLRRVFTGLKNIEIAEDLDVSEQTVKDHLSNVYAKTGVKNRFELVSFLLNSPRGKQTDTIPLPR